MVDVILSYVGEKFAFHELDSCIKNWRRTTLNCQKSSSFSYRLPVPKSRTRYIKIRYEK